MVTLKEILKLAGIHEDDFGDKIVLVEDLESVFELNNFDKDIPYHFWEWLLVKVVEHNNQVSMNDLLLLKKEYDDGLQRS